MQPANELPELGDDGELSLEKFCAHCGSPNHLDAEYCANCNESLSGTTLQKEFRSSSRFRAITTSWFPYREFSIFTPESVESAASRLAKSTVKRRWGLRIFPSNVGGFEGEVSVTGFNLNRIINNRNSFLPYLIGKFEPIDGGTQVIVRLEMHPITYFIVMIICGVCVLGILKGILLGGHGIVEPAGFFLFVYCVMIVAFNFEAYEAVAYIQDVFSKRKNEATNNNND